MRKSLTVLTIKCLFWTCTEFCVWICEPERWWKTVPYTNSPGAEKARSPSLVRVRTVMAALVVADQKRLLLESMLNVEIVTCIVLGP